MGYKAILSIVPSLQATGLLGRSVGFAKKGKGAVKTGMSIFVGVPLLSKTASMIKGL